jgi:large subunit ribosomal protein L9
MKVILLSDVKNVGKKGDLVNVADGYGRNYLIANRLAVEASKRSIEILDDEKVKAAEAAKNKELEAIELSKQLSTVTLEFKVKSNKGSMFGTISSKQIADELDKMSIKIDKRKILKGTPISDLGYTNVIIELHPKVQATIKVHVISE